jgi:SAM-dependent methyltransferase
MSDQDHWEAVYRSKPATDVSWFQPRLEQSLRLIDACALPPSAHVVDVGGGASTLVDDLLARGFTELTVIDLAAAALEQSQARLGARAHAVRWIAGDVTTPLLAPASVDLWHDRAVFHFLVDPAQRTAYVEQLLRALRPGGHALIATFAPDGPERCSGLPVARYAAQDIATALGPSFALIDSAHEHHGTPSGATQSFTYALCRRTGG